jgi:hypothetical protein
MSNNLSALSAAQLQVYNAIQAGTPKNQIIRELGLTEGTFAAQCTRIRTKGIQLPEFPGAKPPSSTSPAPVASGHSPQPAATGEKVLDDAFQAGEPVFDVEGAIREAQKRGDIHGDMAAMHPMAVMGVAICFMRMCGGRFHAHQVLEDVYGAIRAFSADGPSADDVVKTATKPFTASDITQDDLDQFTNKVDSVKGELEELLGRLSPAAAPTS